MKAAVCIKYGSPSNIKVVDMAIPQPKENEILIKIHASTVTSGDARIRRADPFVVRLIFGCSRPRKSVLGVVVAGEVVAIGNNVSNFKVGDRIFGTTGMSFGAHAQYKCVDQFGVLTKIPDAMTYNEAAAIPFGATAAIHFLRKGQVNKGQKVLIYGASGAIGTVAIQLAKALGAEVAAVCSGKNLSLVKSLGADKVIDYTNEDFTKNGIQYDVIFDTVGKSRFSSNLNSLSKNGKILLASASVGLMIRGSITSLFGSKKIVSGVIKETKEDMLYFNQLFKSKKLKPVIDKVYSIDDIAEAHAYVDEGHKKGNVIVSMNHTS